MKLSEITTLETLTRWKEAAAKQDSLTDLLAKKIEEREQTIKKKKWSVPKKKPEYFALVYIEKDGVEKLINKKKISLYGIDQSEIEWI